MNQCASVLDRSRPYNAIYMIACFTRGRSLAIIENEKYNYVSSPFKLSKCAYYADLAELVRFSPDSPATSSSPPHNKKSLLILKSGIKISNYKDVKAMIQYLQGGMGVFISKDVYVDPKCLYYLIHGYNSSEDYDDLQHHNEKNIYIEDVNQRQFAIEIISWLDDHQLSDEDIKMIRDLKSRDTISTRNFRYDRRFYV